MNRSRIGLLVLACAMIGAGARAEESAESQSADAGMQFDANAAGAKAAGVSAMAGLKDVGASLTAVSSRMDRRAVPGPKKQCGEDGFSLVNAGKEVIAGLGGAVFGAVAGASAAALVYGHAAYGVFLSVTGSVNLAPFAIYATAATIMVMGLTGMITQATRGDYVTSVTRTIMTGAVSPILWAVGGFKAGYRDVKAALNGQ